MYSRTLFSTFPLLLRKNMDTGKFQKPENLCNNIYFLLFLAKKRYAKNASADEKCGALASSLRRRQKNSPHYRAEAAPRQIRLAQTVFGFIRLHSSQTCILRQAQHKFF
jgi:hypothetical protein